MLTATQFLHRHSIMHRDLKSDNIFVTLNERKEIAQVAIGDFDCAKAVSRQSAAKTVLGVRTLCVVFSSHLICVHLLPFGHAT